MMDLIRQDLRALGIEHGVFTSERTLVNKGGVESAIGKLNDRGLIYDGTLEPPKGRKDDNWEPRVQTLFKSSDFGDDTDRTVRKRDGSWTYFATDLAYHQDKHQRGFNKMINIWGADHGGYVKRMISAVAAITHGQGELDIKLCQMVNLMENGKAVAFAIFNLQARGEMFVTHNDPVYEGMIVGLSSKSGDLEINVLKGKKLTNMRTQGTDENVVLTPVRKMAIAEQLSILNTDEA